MPDNDRTWPKFLFLVAILALATCAWFIFHKPAHGPEPIQQTLVRLTQNPDPSDAASILSGLRQEFARLPKETAVGEIAGFLRSGADAPGGLEFKIGANGFMESAPTLRVFLLDYLGQIDRVAAKSVSEEILEGKRSADEWAIALRNYARADSSTAGREFLNAKLREMLNHQPWRAAPSTGFLEAFDVAVFLGGTDLLPDLAALLRQKDSQALAHAAFLALDRLVIAQPGEALAYLLQDNALTAGREITRANYFARADARDPVQRRLLEDYLLNPKLDGAELDKFAALYPNANFMISHNLLTRDQTLDGATLAARDTAALQTVGQWLEDPRFANRKPQLERIQLRLEEFAKTSGAQSNRPE